MTVSLGGISLDNNLYLDGVKQDLPVYSSITPLLGGNDVVQITANSGGKNLELIARKGPPRIGKFCSHQILAINVLARQMNSVVLIHPEGTFNVYVLRLEDLVEMEEREPISANKAYAGRYILKEV